MIKGQGTLTEDLKRTLKRAEWMGEVEHSLDCEMRGGGESEDEGGDGLLGHLRKTRPWRPETVGGGVGRAL